MPRLHPTAVLLAAAGMLALTAGLYTWRWCGSGSGEHATYAVLHWAMVAVLLGRWWTLPRR